MVTHIVGYISSSVHMDMVCRDSEDAETKDELYDAERDKKFMRVAGAWCRHVDVRCVRAVNGDLKTDDRQ